MRASGLVPYMAKIVSEKPSQLECKRIIHQKSFMVAWLWAHVTDQQGHRLYIEQLQLICEKNSQLHERSWKPQNFFYLEGLPYTVLNY